MRVAAVLTAVLLAAVTEAAPAPEPALGVGAVLGALAFGGVSGRRSGNPGICFNSFWRFLSNFATCSLSRFLTVRKYLIFL